MKAYTSRERFDERRRFTGVFHQMGRPHLDSDHNEGERLAAVDRIRRSGDLAEGSPDDGFAPSELHLVEPVITARDFALIGPEAGDTRDLRLEAGLTRRDPETLPQVFRARGVRGITRTFPTPLDVDHLPIPSDPAGGVYPATELVLRVRIVREITDDELVDPHLVLIDLDGAEHRVPVRVDDGEASTSLGDLGDGWRRIRVPRASFATLPTDADGVLRIGGWGLRRLSPRSEVFVGELLADPGLPDTDFVIRGGDGPLARAGRIYVRGIRSFAETDWRYTLQPDLPLPAAIEVPAPPDAHRYLVVLDLWEREIAAFEDPFLIETALDGEDTAWRRRLVSQVRVIRVAGDAPEELPPEVGGVRLWTDVPEGAFPDRFPPERPDPCRDPCLFTENVSTGEGYRGTDNVHVRIELLTVGSRTAALWSRNNAATVAPLAFDAPATASAVVVDPADAARFRAGDVVVIEDRHSRLDPAGPRGAVLRQLRAVNAATGQLEFHGATHALTHDPEALPAGGPLGRAFARADRAAVRRWDGADWVLPDVRYNLADGITFRFGGTGGRPGEYWSFVARVENPDGGSLGVVDTLEDAEVAGPRHTFARLGRISWSTGEDGAVVRRIEDLRDRFLPLKEVRDRLIELGRRKLSPGAFTVVVGDGVRTFGDIDQLVAEGVTGDEAIQHAIDKVRLEGGGTVYVRAGTYLLEHAVLLEGASGVHVLGDGDATVLRVTGAGGAFYLDDCGADGQVEIELLRIEEDPEAAVAFGLPVAPRVGLGPAPAPPRDYLRPDDLGAAQPSIPELATALGASLATPDRAELRISGSVVGTLKRLRSLQRTRPDRPLEEVAPDELAVLQSLPHGVITVSDSADVRLRRLRLDTEAAPSGGGLVAAGVLVVGTCRDLVVEDNRVTAPYGMVAAAYAPYLGPAILAQKPFASLSLAGLVVRGNRLTGRGAADVGVRIADGVIEGVEVADNRITGFPTGVSIEDRAELRTTAVDRSRVADNAVLGSTRHGIRVVGDGVEVAGNEIRPSPSAEGVQAGVQVVGIGVRVRDCWIALPGGAAPALAVVAGILVGDGVDAPLARPVADVEIADNRVEAGAGSGATGILLGGNQPIHGVRIRGNVLRGLGDAGIRAWGHGGPIGALQVEGNRVEDVARHLGSWSDAVRAELVALAPTVAGLSAVTSARSALERLLAHPNDAALAGLDAMLRWFERATLRGGIVLTQVEDARVRGNQVARVGVTARPPGGADPGAEVRTAGIAAVGGLSLAVSDNRIDEVRAPLQLEAPTTVPPAPGSGRLPIVDRLQALALADPTTAGSPSDLYGSLVALRRLASAFSASSGAKRAAVEARMYGPLAAAVDVLEALGGAAKGLADELRSAADEVRRAPDAATQTARAHALRAVLADAAAAAASDPRIATVWTTASRLDRAIERGGDAVATEAAAIRKAGDELTRGMASLELGFDEVFARLARSPDDAAARNAAVATLDRVGEARADLVAYERGLVGTDLAPSDRTLVSTLAEGIGQGIDKLLKARKLDPALVDELAHLTASLAAAVRKVNTALALDLQADFGQLVGADGQLDAAAAERLRITLGRIEAVAKEGATATAVRSADLDRLVSVYEEQLVRLTASALETAVRDASAGGTSRELDRLVADATQLRALVAEDREKAPIADRVLKSLEAARSSKRPAVELGTARDALVELQAAVAPAPGGDADPDEPAATVEVGRIAALGQAILALRAARDPARNADATELFADHLGRLLDLGGAGAFARSGALSRVRAAGEVLGETVTGEAADAAWLALATELETAALPLAADARTGSALAAELTLVGVTRRALAWQEIPASRLTSVSAFLDARQGALSRSLVDRLRAARDVETLLREALAAFAVITGVAADGAGGPGAGNEPPPLPADGLFTAGVGQRLDLADNAVERCAAGVWVRDPAGHVLADPDADPGAVVSVHGNRVLGCVSAGLDLRPGGRVQLRVEANHLAGNLGLARGIGAVAPAVAAIVGGGELTLGRNHLHDNGDPTRAVPVHGLYVDWRGDVTVSDNRVRQLGGAALIVLAEAIDPALVARLTTTAALEVEPAPRTEPPPPPKAGTLGAVADQFELGAFRATAFSATATYQLLAEGPRVFAASTVAASYAASWTAAPQTSVLEALLAFVKRAPIPLFPLFPAVPPPARRSVAVTGNALVSAGPALLLLADGGALVAAQVVGNELESTGTTGAAYLRRVDTTVFAGNRCESVDQVNVVVVRAGRSLVTITGNALAGREPPAPPPKPTPAPPPGKKGAVSLLVNLGDGLTFARELDSAVLGQLLDQQRDLDFAGATDAAESELQRFYGMAAGKALAADIVARWTGAGAEPAEPAAPSRRSTAARVIDAAATRTLELLGASAPAADGIRVPVTEAKVDPATADALDAAPLSPAAKVMGLYLGAGYSRDQARAELQSHLARANGDPSVAWSAARNRLGVQPLLAAPAQPSTSVLEQVLLDAIRDPAIVVADPPPARVPPNPRHFSLVVVGGSRVAAVGNVTTAGVHVHDAAQSVQTNV